MPAGARQDLLEWNSTNDAPTYFAPVLSHEYSVPASLNPDASIEVTDDQPFNEYYLLRRLLNRWDDQPAVKP
jgi:hypothetical protein